MKKRLIVYGSLLVIIIGLLICTQYYYFGADNGANISIDELGAPDVPDTGSNSNTNPDDKRVLIGKVDFVAPFEISNQSLFLNAAMNNASYFKIGTVEEGVHKAKDVLRVHRESMYPGDNGLDYMLATKDDSGAYVSYQLLTYSDESWNVELGYNTKKVSPLVAKIPELDMPETFSFNGETFEYVDTLGVWKDNSSVMKVIDATVIGKIFIASDGVSAPLADTEYELGKGGFYALTKDHRVAVYRPRSLDSIATQLIAGEKFRYVDFGGCGARNVTAVVSLPMSQFQAIGTAPYDNATIYELKDKNHEIYKSLYGMAYFDGEYDAENRISFEEFVKRKPVVFWKDAYGRMIKFISDKLTPMAECGKPVIYLYPEETTAVRVEVEPKGGFSITIPEYGNGWNVIATPESVITNTIDGVQYPYLFWEGRGGLYKAPEQGFVVKQENVETFLDDTLAAYGLNKKEIADFKEFWLPRMTGSPYYFVSFYDNRVMDKLAPLTISPRPDTVIRVLMDFKGLESPIEVKGYEIPHRERKGFTVVEWGGVIQ